MASAAFTADSPNRPPPAVLAAGMQWAGGAFRANAADAAARVAAEDAVANTNAPANGPANPNAVDNPAPNAPVADALIFPRCRRFPLLLLNKIFPHTDHAGVRRETTTMNASHYGGGFYPALLQRPSSSLHSASSTASTAGNPNLSLHHVFTCRHQSTLLPYSAPNIATSGLL